jgi:hypothetical protein
MDKSKANWIMIDFNDSHWELSSPKDFSSFLHGLPILFDSNTTLYLEDGTPPDELKFFFDENCLSEKTIIPHGTIWPRPKAFHLPITIENIKELSDLSENYAEPQVAVHAHVYKDNKLLLQWYDAFADPILISPDIKEHQIRDFSAALHVNYKLKRKASNE